MRNSMLSQILEQGARARCELSYSCFQCCMHSSYLVTSIFQRRLLTGCLKWANHKQCRSVFCFMSLLCKWASSSKCHASELWLVDFVPSCLLSLSKDECPKITTIMHYACNTERGCNHCLRYGLWLNQTQSLTIPLPTTTSRRFYGRVSSWCYNNFIQNPHCGLLEDWHWGDKIKIVRFWEMCMPPPPPPPPSEGY